MADDRYADVMGEALDEIESIGNSMPAPVAPMTDEQLAEIRKRMDGATAGPWAVEDGLHVVAGDGPSHIHIADLEWLADTDEEWKEFERNATFVAAARQDVADLLAEVGRLRAKLKQPCGMCHPCVNWAAETWRQAGRRPPHVHEWDELREQVKRVQDPDLIRRAIADPGAYAERKLDNGEPAETVPAWGARAVIAALDGTEPAAPDPRQAALEQLADRYPAAFEFLHADARAKATRKDGGQ